MDSELPARSSTATRLQHRFPTALRPGYIPRSMLALRSRRGRERRAGRDPARPRVAPPGPGGEGGEPAGTRPAGEWLAWAWWQRRPRDPPAGGHREAARVVIGWDWLK